MRGAKHLHLPAMCTRAVLKISKDTDFLPCQYHFSLLQYNFIGHPFWHYIKLTLKTHLPLWIEILRTHSSQSTRQGAYFVLQTSSRLTLNMCISHGEFILTSVLSWTMTFSWIRDKESHWKSSDSRIDHVICSLAEASVLLNERPQHKNNNQEENLFSKLWKKKQAEKSPPAPLDELAYGVRNAKGKGEYIAVNLSELLYLFH